MLNRLPIEEYIQGILSGNKIILSRAITLLESNLKEDQFLSEKIVHAVIDKTGKSMRIGITGVPGVGKSTFIETLGNYLISLKKKIAVLAVDPSSSRSKGSIMGDKTRMQKLSQDPLAYIRPSSSKGITGGVAPKTREAMLLCEAAGFEVIMIETVGVGQSEIIVKQITDFFLLLALTGAGDELQSIKKGIIEIAQVIIITKADSNNIEEAEKNKAIYSNALKFSMQELPYWKVKILTCSALENKGIKEIWDTIEDFYRTVNIDNRLEEIRKKQNLHWMHQSIKQLLISNFYRNVSVKEVLPVIKKKVVEQHLSPYKAARELLKIVCKKSKNNDFYKNLI